MYKCTVWSLLTNLSTYIPVPMFTNMYQLARSYVFLFWLDVCKFVSLASLPVLRTEF
jgi:hypothetical protein